MSTQMRAKLRVSKVELFEGSDRVTMNAVCRSEGYPEDGSDEDNTFARFTPDAELSMAITNPDLLSKIRPGELYYVDFTPVE